MHGHIVTDEHLDARCQWLQTIPNENLSNCQPLEFMAVTLTRQEPIDRWTTRIGGLPAWRSDNEWPDCAKCGEQLAFAAQLDFRGTTLRSLVPGDVMVFHYCFACCPWWKGDNAELFTWCNETESSQLIEEEIIPEDLEGFEHGPFYGVHTKAVDYSAFGMPDDSLDDDKFWSLFYRGTKVGGHPPMHPDECPEASSGQRMTYLGCLNSTEASDVPKIRDGIRRPACGELMFADVGCIHFWGQNVNGTFEMDWNLESG